MRVRDHDLQQLVTTYVIRDAHHDFSVACANDRWIVAKWLDHLFGCAADNGEALRAVFRGRNFAAILWLVGRCPRESGFSTDIRVLRWAQRHIGRKFALNMLKHSEANTTLNPETLRWILRTARPGRELVEWFMDCLCSGPGCEYFGPYRHLLQAELLEWSAQAGRPLQQEFHVQAVEQAIRAGDVHVARKLCEMEDIPRPLTFRIRGDIYRIGDFENTTTRCLHWAYRAGYITRDTLQRASDECGCDDLRDQIAQLPFARGWR